MSIRTYISAFTLIACAAPFTACESLTRNSNNDREAQSEEYVEPIVIDEVLNHPGMAAPVQIIASHENLDCPNLTEPSVQLIRTQEDARDSQCCGFYHIDIDWETQDAILIAQGLYRGTWLDITWVDIKEDKLYVNCQREIEGTEARSYAIVVIPNTNATSVELDIFND